MKFEDLKKMVFVQDPRSGVSEFRDKKTGQRVLTEGSKKIRENLELALYGDAPLGPALKNALEDLSLEELVVSYPDDLEQILGEIGDALSSGIMDAQDPLVNQDRFNEDLRMLEIVTPQIKVLSNEDRAMILSAIYKGGLVDVMLNQGKWLNASHYRLFYEAAKQSVGLAPWIHDIPPTERLPEQEDTLALVDQIKKNLSKFSGPIRKVVGEAFMTEAEAAAAAESSSPAKPEAKREERHEEHHDDAGHDDGHGGGHH